MTRLEFQKLGESKLGKFNITKVISRAKKRGYFNTRTTDFSIDIANEIIEWETNRKKNIIASGNYDEHGKFKKGCHINKGKTKTEQHKTKISNALKGNTNAKGKHNITQEQHNKWSQMRKHTIPWNYSSELHKLMDLTGYGPITIRKNGWTLENYKSKSFRMSICEDELANWVASIYNGKILRNTRKVIPPKELDIYIPEKKVAIEYNGLYWHSDIANNDRYYHYNKTTECEKKGIRLIHIYSDEWKYKQEIVKSIIASALGVYEKKIPARLTVFKEIDTKEGRIFFEANHIKGDCNAFRYIGLYYNDILVMCASFRKTFTNTEKHIELARMATLLNTQVVGGFSKLLKNSGYDKIESFVDRRLFNGNSYYSTGWFWLAPSLPGYSYTDFDKRYGRQMFMKKSCLKKWPNSDPFKSEQELCAENGLYRIYDSGNYKLYWKNTNLI